MTGTLYLEYGNAVPEGTPFTCLINQDEWEPLEKESPTHLQVGAGLIKLVGPVRPGKPATFKRLEVHGKILI
jgi:hypothetical protein